MPVGPALNQSPQWWPAVAKRLGGCSLGRPLTLNWIEGRPSLAGGVKSNKLIAEAMARRGHRVTISHLPPTLPWPPVWRVRTLVKRAALGMQPGRFRHHLETAAVPINRLPKRVLDPALVPDADVTFASWWRVWRAVAAWPESKGLKVHYVRHHEVYAGPRAEVDAAYALPGPKVVISSWLADVMRDYGHQDVIRIPNGVAWKQFDSQPRSRAERPTVGMLMGTASFKDTPTGLKALAIVRRQIPNLRIIGFGQRPPPESWEMPEGVEFHYQPEQSAIPGLYQACDCWIVPSSSEGFAMPGIEAAASHCPLVCTRCGGPEDFVTPGRNGYLVDVGDAEAMAAAVVRVLSQSADEWRRMSEASYEIAQEFDWDLSAEKLESNLYRWLDEARNSAA